MSNKPVNFVSWYNAARFVNWLHNDKPTTGVQNNSTTENGSYQLTGNTGNPTRDFAAKYFIPTENEWYKAAYYKAGGTNAGYWTYATSSNLAPTCVSATTDGNGVIL
jgi:formylglycine-generating enzyme required for sulfatase activity